MTASPSFLRQLTVMASTKRSPNFSGVKRGAAAGYLGGVAIAPLMPVSDRILNRMQGTPYTLLETFCEAGHDIENGDYLVIDGRDYPVRFVEKWAGFLSIAVEDLQNKRPL